MIEYCGNANSSSHARGHLPETAFRATKRQWTNRGNVFPSTVWFQFHEPKKVTKLSFTNRIKDETHSNETQQKDFEQSPKKIDIVAADSKACAKDDPEWTTLLEEEHVGFEDFEETKMWRIPAEKQGIYLCYGLRVYSSIGTQGFAAVRNVLMWEEK